jgi:RND family efflux transporter MFP subunit
MMSATVSVPNKRRIFSFPLFAHLPKWLRWAGLALLLVLIGAGTFFLLRAKQASAAAATSTTTMQTATARQGNLVLQASGAGYLVAATEASVGFDVSGKIASLEVKLGDQVEKGQLLAKLDDTDLQTALENANLNWQELTSAEAIANARLSISTAEAAVITAQSALNGVTYWQNEALIQEYYAKYLVAKANLERAQDAYDRANVGEYLNNTDEANLYQQLYNAQQAFKTAEYYYSMYSQKPSQRQTDAAQATLALEQAKLQNAKDYLQALTSGTIPASATGADMSNLRQAHEAITTAEENLAAANLYAPISGTVMTLNAKAGDNVNGSILTIDALNPATIQFYLDASDWTNLKVGYAVSVTFDALPGQTFTGKVIEVMPGLVSAQGSSMVEGTAALDKSVEEIGLPVGIDANIDVISGQALNAVLIPVEALHKLSDGSYTVFVMQNGKPVLKTVEVGLQDDTYAQIKSGLSAGDVVTTGIVETK